MLKLALRGEEIKVGDVIFQFISGFPNSETVQTVETRMCLKQQRIRYVFSNIVWGIFKFIIQARCVSLSSSILNLTKQLHRNGENIIES